MNTFLYLLMLLRFPEDRSRRVAHIKKAVVVFEEKFLPTVVQFFPKAQIVSSLSELTWADLLWRRFVFVGDPPKENGSFELKLKRSFIRLFFGNFIRIINVWKLLEIIVLPTEKSTIYLPALHIIDMFKKHFPNFDVQPITSYKSFLRNAFLWGLLTFFLSARKDETVTKVVFINILDPFLLTAYRKLHPQKKIIVRIHDVVRPRQYFYTSKAKLYLLRYGIVDGIESYCEADAARFDIKYQPNGVNREYVESFKKDYTSYIYSFVGANKKRGQRAEFVKQFREYVKANYPQSLSFIKEHFAKDASQFVTYPEYLDLMSQSEAVIDFYRVTPDEGWSFRIPEAMVLGKKVVTNRMSILHSEIYHPSRFFVLGHDSMDGLKGFLETPFVPLTEDLYQKICTDHWWKG